MDMTQTRTDTAVDTNSRGRRPDQALAALTTGLAGLTYLVWRIAGVEPAVRSGQGTHEVGLVSVLVTAAVVAYAGLGLLRFIERRDARALRTWTLLASLVWLGSFLGPTGAADLASGLALASLHLVVGGSVVVGARWIRLRGVA
jgi:uncharacterized membrane-anchored protein